MLLMTAHRTLVGTDTAGGIVQYRPQDDASHFVDIASFTYEAPIGGGALAGFLPIQTEDGVRFRKESMYLCADPHDRSVLANRKSAAAWETFYLVPIDELEELRKYYVSKESEVARFKTRVAEIKQEGLPVKIYCGCGTIVRPGFLHIDIEIMASGFSRTNPEDYFIFPFADQSWTIPDSSIDYIFHEDLIEHMNQLQQIQFLTETFRVMKKGAYHRINTPNLIASMKENSDFSKGFGGVYTGERDLWSHVLLFTPGYIKEIAQMIGYEEIVYTTKNGGVSEHAIEDIRPLSDRSAITGNVFVDLMK